MLGALNVLLGQVLPAIKLAAVVSTRKLVFIIIVVVIVGTTTTPDRFRWPGSRFPGFPWFTGVAGLAGSVGRLLETHIDFGATRFRTAVGFGKRVIVVILGRGLPAALAVPLLGLVGQLCFGRLAQVLGGSMAADRSASFLPVIGGLGLGSHAKFIVFARH
jgi:hypothetical protein